MYHCHIQFCLIGGRPGLFDPIRQAPPLNHFTHTFTQTAQPVAEEVLRADVIFADLEGLDATRTLEDLLSFRQEGTELIVIAAKEQIPQLSSHLSELDDLWTAPLSGEELHFHFLRWQQRRHERTDAWQTAQYLDATINSIPNLIWYKTKDGVHVKVNDSFCHTVNKTKEQVQGQRHAYIWDVEHDDPACIESERLVMERRQTQISVETILTGVGERLLTTYKSPLYDFDGEVMGTVGVAIDVTRERAYAEAIVQKNRSLEAIFTTMDCGIMCHTLDGSRIISVNQAALRLLGYESEAELTIDGFHMVAASVIEEDRERMIECIQSLKSAGDSVSIEYRVRHRDGRLLHIMGNVKLVEEDGELFYQRFLLDCTAQKERESAERTAKERRHMELVQALSIDYSLVCVFDLDTGAGQSLRIGNCESGTLGRIFSGPLDLQTCMEEYITTCVHPDDREEMRLSCAQAHLRQGPFIYGRRPESQGSAPQ